MSVPSTIGWIVLLGLAGLGLKTLRSNYNEAIETARKSGVSAKQEK